MAAILRVKTADGQWIEIPAIAGKTPVKGVDYYTSDDIKELKNSIIAELHGTDEVYQEINSITLDGGESAVEITEDSDKSSFALTAAYVKVEMPASSDSGTGYIETYYGAQRISKHHIANIKQSASSPKTAKAEVIQRYGRWVEYTYGAAAEGATSNMLNIVQFVLEATTEELKHIDKIKVRVTGNITFDAGTKITVWGVT